MVEGHTNWTTMFLQILFLICSVCNTHGVASAASTSCPADEYRAGQLCCLACPGGYRVHRDCSATANTLCSKCPDGTFKEGLSGQKQCSACTQCVTGQEVKKFCTPTSDTECEIRDGFFCSESADKDTFSEATLSCQPHTICDSGVQIQPGTDSTDSTCITYVAIVFIIIGCICFIILIVVLGALFYRWLKVERDLTELEKQIDEMETPEQVEECLDLWERLYKKKKTQKQKRKFDKLDRRHDEKMETMDLVWVFNEDAYRKCLEETEEPNRKLNAWIDLFLEQMKNRELDRDLTEKADLIHEKQMKKEELHLELTELIDQLLEETKEQKMKLTVLTDCPEPTRDQQEHTIPTIPDETMDDQHDDQSPAPPSSSTHNGSVSVSVHQEDHQPVHIKRDNGASRSTPLSLMRSSTSQSAGERVSLLIDNIVAEAEVTPVLENRY